ncbi:MULTISPECIES: AbrB/MazE/SpoVT family DNA-binding domain-containing protein [Aminobacter]|jgi:antitoxin PrlF|uniref:AbrB family looped-hinge helix DNA binding protein n=1 Tax=Aminobacter ciceronei TaxID=150723 RepID=A0ABR6C6U1_9HYPH|nr:MULTISPECIES: AbrB/MazE/SpoVT family DNA-binding domain-containing protein [Aminobacter]MBA8907005.1 AbrB family looped-hinge helix DNA binding protein [Aminobacter ciceronei]MBA9020737.1 AbrB family looped-hinge helix DNA binding protein [Aminobacter ciceronei]MRX35978.1 AbrB/MazE/SpoVT family DNA-binding domain-containing protein [Aminobacter sp. MDW-2]QNH35803.1 AbrB/MazE/SpoVT family DNA-binding domain-containing protein [Aminobacter sp. MDW-2]BBD40056.1 Holliday junction resolvase [Ami
MRVTSKGQVTIPRDLRETFGIGANTEVIFGIEGGKITIVPKDEINRLADRDRLDRFLAILDRLEGAGDLATNGDEMLALVKGR